MNVTFTRIEELRNDLDNLHFILRYKIRVLAELEQLGRTCTPEFKKTENNLNILKKNIKRLEEELEKLDKEEFDEEEDPYYFSAGMHW